MFGLGALTSVAVLAFVLSSNVEMVVAQDPNCPGVEPLIDRRYLYPSQIPYKVDTDDCGRGPQSGYTLCNSTTEGQDSLCQLAMINAIDKFCLWGPTGPDSTIADTEAATVAWCTIAGYGTRIMPAGTLTGVQFLRAPSYILVAGTINQQNIDIYALDSGGEMDPHGADGRGNPLGSLVYSNAFPSNNGNNNSFQQVIEWHNFMGSQVFCFKICDPAISGSAVYCNNIYDETGCNFVAPASYTVDVFEVCDSDNMDPVGVYTSNGVVMTYTQPAVVVTLPSIRTPASSNCVTYSSQALYAGEGTVTTSSSGTSTGNGSSTPTGSGATTKSTGSSSSSAAKSKSTTSQSGAVKVQVSAGGAGIGVLVGVMFVAGLGGLVAVL